MLGPRPPLMRAGAAAAVVLALCASRVRAQDEPAAVAAPDAWLVLDPVDVRSRRPFNPDAVFARYLLDPASAPPEAGDALVGERGEKRAWRAAKLDERGRLRGPFAYAYAAVRADRPVVALARIPGGARLYVNGAAFAGDIYASGHEGVPVFLARGVNHVFLRGVRGAITPSFRVVAEGVHLLARDATLPDLLPGRPLDRRGAAVVVNASLDPAPGLVPLGLRKPPAHVGPPVLGASQDTASARVQVASCGVARMLPIAERNPARAHRRLFRSRIDDTIQEYAVVPPSGAAAGAGAARGLVLTLHGASVPCLNQARAYAPKDDLWLVAPTNRRPFGFDWQDWGRQDAYEVLAEALRLAGTPPATVYLTGHSMGGHGTWCLAANDPDRFLALAPSAGWCSFDTYAGGRRRGARTELWHGADGMSNTLALIDNLAALPIYVLHGDKDDNVPPSEARRMLAALEAAGARPASHFEEGAGHWWNRDPAPGADCVDWPPIFELFARTRPPAADAPPPATLSWVSVDPGVDARHHWVEVAQPLAYGRPFRVRAERRDGGALVSVATENVRRLRVRLSRPPARVELDGVSLPWTGVGFVRTPDGGWRAAARTAAAAGEKHPGRCGPFKRAFDRGFVFVVGRGDAEGLARARFDAQMWWYRGNGDVEILDDAAFLARPARDENVILYGHADGNRAFAAVLGPDEPVRVRAGRIAVGETFFDGEDLGCLLVRPRVGGAGGALVGVFGYTGSAGARLGYTLMPFVAGVGMPDYAVFSADVLSDGDGGVRAAGWFDHAWALPPKASATSGK